MHTLFALVLTAAAAVVIAHPPGSIGTTTSNDDPVRHMPNFKYMNDDQLPRNIWPHYISFDEGSDTPKLKELQLNMPVTQWLTLEIERLNRMRGRTESIVPFVPRQQPIHKPLQMEIDTKEFDLRNFIQSVNKQPESNSNLAPEKSEPEESESDESESEEYEENNHEKDKDSKARVPAYIGQNKDLNKNLFALTPKDKGYFESKETENLPAKANTALDGLHEGGGKRAMQAADLPLRPELKPVRPREIRQNPNLGRTKTLVAENLDKLRIGLRHDENDPLDTLRHMTMLDGTDVDSTDNFYGVALISGIGAVGVLAVLGFAFGWYTLSKRAKAAADVDYPAYGVTGPTIDTSGDRKLAHSAHMYHYQHQKQQIIAMERNGMDERSGSVSDPESDEENEEGDYTVYECPGFATTGDMEVKNPLFNEEPTPATPANCELVNPQPKE